MEIFVLWLNCHWHRCHRKGNNPYSKVHGANMGPTWVLSAPDGPHVGPMNLAIREALICTKGGLVHDGIYASWSLNTLTSLASPRYLSMAYLKWNDICFLESTYITVTLCIKNKSLSLNKNDIATLINPHLPCILDLYVNKGICVVLSCQLGYDALLTMYQL